MAIGKEIQLYSDIAKSQPVYPKTNTKCVYDDYGNCLGALPRFNFTLLKTDVWTKNAHGTYELDKNVPGVKVGMTAFLIPRRGQADGLIDDLSFDPSKFDEDAERLGMIRACRISADDTLHLVATEDVSASGELALKLVVIA
jgi:hypothetical protein